MHAFQLCQVIIIFIGSGMIVAYAVPVGILMGIIILGAITIGPCFARRSKKTAGPVDDILS